MLQEQQEGNSPAFVPCSYDSSEAYLIGHCVKEDTGLGRHSFWNLLCSTLCSYIMYACKVWKNYNFGIGLSCDI